MKQTIIFLTSLTVALSLLYTSVFAWSIDYDGERSFPLPPLPPNESMVYETGFVIASNDGVVDSVFMAYDNENVMPFNIINGKNLNGYILQDVWLVSTEPFHYQVFTNVISQTVGQMEWSSTYQNTTYTATNTITIDNVDYYYTHYSTWNMREYSLLFGNIDYVSETKLTKEEIIPLVIASQNVPMGQYDATIPYFTNSTIDLTKEYRSSDNLPSPLWVPPTYPVLSGSLSSSLSNGQSYNSSQYVIDYNWHATYTRMKAYNDAGGTPSDSGGTTTQSLYDFIDGSTSLNFNQLNDKLLSQCASLDSWAEHSFWGYSYAANIYKLSISVRLRDRTTGNYGPSYTINYDNLSWLSGTKYKKTSAVVGVTDNIDPSNSASSEMFNEDLSEISKGSISYDGNSMGTSTNRGVLVDGGGYNPQVDISIFSSTFGQVPQMFGAVFSFFPDWVLLFVATAFATTITIAIVKAIL